MKLLVNVATAGYLALALAACAADPVGAPAPPAAEVPALLSGEGCSWLPDAATIEIDGVQTFTPNTIGCGGLPVAITPGTAPFGFTAGNGCNMKSTTTNLVGKFSIRACAAGSGSATVSDSEGGLLQVVQLTTP